MHRESVSHSIPNPASQFQIADHKAYSVRRPQSIPFHERCSSEPGASLVSEQWAKKCQQERKSLALGDAINTALVPVYCASELALSQDQIYMVVYDRRTSAREYETLYPLHPPTLKSISKYGGFWQDGVCKSIWNITLPYHPIQPQTLLKTTEQGTFEKSDTFLVTLPLKYIHTFKRKETFNSR